MNDPTDDGNDGRFPDGLNVLTPFPVTDEQAEGGRDSWPWVAATIISQCSGPDEWQLVIEDERAAAIDDGADGDGRCYPVVFRDAGEIRLPDPTVEELREIFSGEWGTR